MAGTPATVNPIGDIMPTPAPPAGSVESEVLQLHSMGLHNLAAMLEKSAPAAKKEEPKKDTHHA